MKLIHLQHWFYHQYNRRSQWWKQLQELRYRRQLLCRFQHTKRYICRWHQRRISFRRLIHRWNLIYLKLFRLLSLRFLRCWWHFLLIKHCWRQWVIHLQRWRLWYQKHMIRIMIKLRLRRRWEHRWIQLSYFWFRWIWR